MERYGAYKDSGVEWIGEIPAGWASERLKYLTTNRVMPADSDTGEYLGLENVQPWTMRICRDQENPTDAAGIFYDVDCVLFGKLRPYLAKVVLPNSAGPCSSEFLVLIPNGINRVFLAYLLTSESFINEVNALTYGVRMPRAGWDLIGNIRIPIPAFGEQQAIADYLDAKTDEIDALVAECEREVVLLHEYRKALISEVIARGLQPEIPMRESGIESVGLIPDGWNVYKLRWLCSFHNGDRGVNYPSAGDFQDEGIPFYGADALIGDIADTTQARFITRERYDAMGGLKIKAFDTLYTLRGSTIGKNAIAIQPEGTVASSLMGIRVRRFQDIDPWYLHYWLNSYQEFQQRDACINGSTAPNLSAEDVAQYRIALPPRELQDEMVREIRKRIVFADGLIGDKQAMADKLREYRRSLISETVTGKFKVPGV